MTIFDLIFIFILFCFVYFGLKCGLIYTLGSLLGIILGAFLAGIWYDEIAKRFLFLFLGNLNLAQVVCFIIIFILINRLIGFVFWIISKIFKIITALPFLKTINRLAGAVLGAIEGIFVLGLTLYLILKYPFWDLLTEAILASKIAYWLIEISQILTLLLPEALKRSIH